IESAQHGSIERHGMEINPCVLRPKSRGSIALRSSDPNEPIRFTTGFLSHADDRATLLAGMKIARKVLR
ncbi:GMC oxidoreductase, partial [Escherichia coli]|uniref:GMC oxidoreductase n=1 Tax=Escherichia coli TaxID=562 RepID=UPI00202F1E60